MANFTNDAVIPPSADGFASASWKEVITYVLRFPSEAARNTARDLFFFFQESVDTI